jgi:hypothetical protein
MVGKWLVAKEKNRCAVVFLTATRQRRTNPNGGGRYLVFLEGAVWWVARCGLVGF